MALVRLARRAPSHYATLLGNGDSAERLLVEELSDRDGQETLLPEDPEPLLATAAADIARWQAEGYRLLTVLDHDYPSNLRKVHDRPPLILVDGEVRPEDTRSIAVIGTRRATSGGVAAAHALATAIARAGYVVVSGLAAGIDTAAHQAALGAAGRTLAVIGTGLARTYPPENADLQRRIAAEGAVISQFWPETEPSRRTFPMRNAVMSGLARATLVVEASFRSGARMQTRLALAHGRPVFLWHELLSEPWARDLAAKPNTHVIDGADQVIATVEALRDTSELRG